jgi:DNA-binding CsgD family transcriptional regulator
VVTAGLHAAGEAPRNGPRRVLAELTRREHQVLTLLAAGKTAKPIATELSVSLTTVRTHIQHILAKLGVHSCLEAVVCLLQATVEESSARGLGQVAARLVSSTAETSSLLRIAEPTETRFDESALLDAAGA